MIRRAAIVFCLAGSVGYAGTIRGTVVFEHEPPAASKVDRSADAKCSQDRADEAVVVVGGKLRDVLVRVKNGTTGAHTAPATPVVIDQRDCTYAPRVVGLVAGQHLVVRNSDNTFHNVRGTLRGKTVWNKPQAANDADLDLDAAASADDVIELKCDVHAWMRAYAVVQDSPFFAVTDARGAFEITGLPPGKYTLQAWHPVLGAKAITVEVGTGKRGDVTARFAY